MFSWLCLDKLNTVRKKVVLSRMSPSRGRLKRDWSRDCRRSTGCSKRRQRGKFWHHCSDLSPFVLRKALGQTCDEC